jgi:hypothetical protein
MRKARLLLLVVLASACGSNDNSIFGVIPESSITPFINFENVGSSIFGRLSLRDASGNPTGSTVQVVIVSDRPNLCDKLKEAPSYLRDPPELYIALVLFLPPTDHLGTFIPGRGGDEGTGSEILGGDPLKKQASIDATGLAVAPFKAIDLFGYIALRDWSESPGGEANGSFNLVYGPPPPLTSNNGFQFGGKFKATYCATLDGTLLP